MKKKVGELYDKPIVIGNPNEFTKNEIALSELGGGESFDDGMVYFKLENPSIAGINYVYCVSCIVENENGDRTLIYTPPGRERIAIQISNKIIYDNSGRTMLEGLILDASFSDLDFENEPTIKQITAKEYYSLLK
jgi:hypothetical protein